MAHGSTTRRSRSSARQLGELLSCRVDWNVLMRWYTGESKNLSGTHGEAIIVDLISC
jgi:hypothetical protein